MVVAEVMVAERGQRQLEVRGLGEVRGHRGMGGEPQKTLDQTC